MVVERFDCTGSCVIADVTGGYVRHSDYEADLAQAREDIARLRGALERAGATIRGMAKALAQDKPLGCENHDILPVRLGGPGCEACEGVRGVMEIPTKGIKQALADAGIEDKPCGMCGGDTWAWPHDPTAGPADDCPDCKPKCGTCGGSKEVPGSQTDETPQPCPECQGAAKVCVWTKNVVVDAGFDTGCGLGSWALHPPKRCKCGLPVKVEPDHDQP